MKSGGVLYTSYNGITGANWDINGEHTRFQTIDYTLYDTNTNDDIVAVKMVVEVVPNNTGEERRFWAQLISQVHYYGEWGEDIYLINNAYQTDQGGCECFGWMMPMRQRAYGTYEWQYNVNPDGETVTITGATPETGDMLIPSMIDGKTVTGIEQWAFSYRSGLTSVAIPDGVTSIGWGAFKGCNRLTSVAIPDSVTNISGEAFSGCSGLISVTVPDSVTHIGYEAFYDCSGLTSVKIPDSTEIEIGDWAFGCCSGLADENGLAIVRDVLCGYYGEGKSVKIPDRVTRIYWEAFDNCNEELFDTNSIPGVKLVDGWAVGYNDSLSGDLDLTGVHGIKDGAFYGCRKLTGVTLPGNLKRIEYGMFKDTGLISVRIPDSVTSIGHCAFALCNELTNVIIGAGVKYIGGMEDLDMTQGAFEWCDNLASVVIPDGVVRIGVAAFSGTGLKSVTIPDSVIDIGEFAFLFSSLTNVALGNGVTSIGHQAFSFTGLKSVTIPANVKNIEYSVFWHCDDLNTVIFRGDAPNIGWDISDIFDEVNPSCVVWVRKSSTGWGVDIPGTLNGLRIEYLPDVIPEIAGDALPEAVSNAIDAVGFVDVAAVKAAIGGKASEYGRFREWAQNTIKDEDAVVSSCYAAASYLLGADRLVPDALTSDDIKIESFEPTAEDGKFAFEVSIADVGIGGGVTITDANREAIMANVRKVLGVEGATTLDESAFSSDNIEITFDVPIDGKARFTATPPANVGNSFFMRVKVK